MIPNTHTATNTTQNNHTSTLLNGACPTTNRLAVLLMLTVGQEQPPWAEFNNGTRSPIRAVAFTPDGELLVSGDKEMVRVWRLDNREPVAVMDAKDVRCIAVSKDSKWIAAGTSWGEMRVWDRQTFKEVLRQDKELDGHTITSLDFSPDAPTRLLVASGNRKPCIWDVATRKKMFTLREHLNWVIAAKFSPRGDRIATATFHEHIQIYDSRNGNLIVTIESAKVTPYYNTGLLWSDNGNNILILSNNAIKRIALSTKSVVEEWSVEDGNHPCIVSPVSGEFVLCSTGYDILLFNPSSSNQARGPEVQLPYDAQSIAVSPDGQFLAIGEGDGKVVVKRSQAGPNHKRTQVLGRQSKTQLKS